MPFFFFLVIVVVGVVVTIAARQHMQAIAAAWTKAAATLGLKYERRGFGRPRIGGTISGMRVEVDVRVQQSGKNQQTFTRYRVWVPSPGFRFKLTRQTGFSRIGKFFGSQDVQTGDVAFDDAFVVKTDSEDRLRRHLTQDLRGTLLRTAAAYPGVIFEDDQVSFERQRLEKSHDVIVSAVRRFVDAGLAISGRRRPTRAAAVVSARERGELAEIAARMREAAREKAESLDDELVELDTLATAGDRDAARGRVRELEKTMPADPDVIGWKQRLDRPKPPGKAGKPESPDAEELAEKVFAGNALSFETQELFDDNYSGAHVHWTGRVKSNDRIRNASDLGAEGDDKLVVTVATIDHDLYGNTDIDAVLGLPAGRAAGMKRGDEVTFTGKLVRVDALVRNIFIADGKLV
jgi:hypothetical protein